ncbi:hypothetical protein M9H77_08143 [Catharanthus roseus]|uniref:Uncharacterized protein n=1 Tax=Catharanthus roseus TaxID=4058 RepID=A0ACC0BX87_CATRO|nr:hypothetical protein M9H77_08143 [Catharanthus roseus]
MMELIDKPILTQKKITQESLEQYKVIELLLGMGCVELALFTEQYDENLVKELYANLTEEFGNSESPAYGQVYVRGHVIDFSPVNIAHYLSCPHYSDIEKTGLKEEVDFDETNRLNSNLIKMPYRVLFIVFYGNWLPKTNVTVIRKKKGHLLYAFATQKNINICTKKASKIALSFLYLITEYLLGYRDLSIPSDSWVRALDPLVMPKSTALSVVPQSHTLSTQGHTALDISTRQQSTKKKQFSVKVASPSPPPPPSIDFSVVTTILDLLNQQISSVIVSVLQMQQNLKNLKEKLP